MMRWWFRWFFIITQYTPLCTVVNKSIKILFLSFVNVIWLMTLDFPWWCRPRDIDEKGGGKQLSVPYRFYLHIFYRTTSRRIFLRKFRGNKEPPDNPTFSREIMMILIIVSFFSLLMFGFVSGTTMKI